MFRISTSVVAARRVLYRSARPDIQVSAFTRSPSNWKYGDPRERETCPRPPPPPPPRPKEDYLLWGTLTLIILTGAFAVYAKSNPELRDYLTIHAPWLDDFVAVLHQENMTYEEFAQKCIKDAKKAIDDYFNPQIICDEDGNVIPQPVPENPQCLPPKPTEGDYVVVEFSDLDSEVDEVADCNREQPPILTKDICQIEGCLKDLSETAIVNYMTARDACVCYKEEVRDTMDDFNMKKLKKLHDALKERKELVEEHIDNAVCATAKLDELSRYFDCGVQAPKDAVKNTKDMLKEYRGKIDTIRIQWLWENDKALAMDTQWKMVEGFVDKYTEQNVLMTKDLKYFCRKPILKGDPDLILHHTKRYVDQLKAQLAEASTGMTERVNRGLESLSTGGECGIPKKDPKERNDAIQAAYKKRLAEVDAALKKRADDKKAENDRIAKEALVKLAEQQQKTLERKLEEETIKATKKLEKMVQAQVEVERKQMAQEKAAVALKLRILEEKLEARLKAERETRRSQELWAAGARLLAATKKGDPVVRVCRELHAIEKASGDEDKLVKSVMKAIPESVRKKGVVPESVLRANYHVMEDVALRVALVEQEGAPLPVFFLSFIQSLFLFMKISGIPQQEYDKPPKEPSKDLDTFDLLQRARFYIERGDIALALKYVNGLEGASRAAAKGWSDAARAHLETRQAAEAILAHAAALGLQYI